MIVTHSLRMLGLSSEVLMLRRNTCDALAVKSALENVIVVSKLAALVPYFGPTL